MPSLAQTFGDFVPYRFNRFKRPWLDRGPMRGL
jgi:hypothetical protein